MFKGVKRWLNIPVGLKKWAAVDGAGDKTYAAAVTVMCYLEGSNKAIRNAAGEEIVSTKQFYFDGAVDITTKDVIVFDGNNKILACHPFFDKVGDRSLLVVYA